MATSRGATPADPVLAATTDDNSRGGLFVRSNIANPVSGADVSGATVGGGEITISATINGGTPATVSFNANQATDITVPLALTVDIPMTNNQGGGGDPVVDGDLINSNTEIRLTLSSGNTVDIPISALATDVELQAAVDMINTRIDGLNIPTSFFGFSDGPTTIGGNGTFLGVVNNALTFTSPPSGATWLGNAGRGDNVGSTPVTPTQLVLDVSTGLVLSNNSGVITIEAAGEAPAGASPPTESAPAPRSALAAPTPEQRRVTYNPAPNNEVTMIDMVSVMRGSTSITIPPANIEVMNGMGTITIPEADASPPGDYTVMSRVTTRNTMTMATDTTDEEATINRFIPYFESAADITADISGTLPASIISSSSAWTGTVPVTVTTTGIFYFAVDNMASGISDATTYVSNGAVGSPRVIHLRTITVTLAGNTVRTYNVFRTQAMRGNTLTNFRTSRFG